MEDKKQHKVGERFEMCKVIYEVRRARTCDLCSVFINGGNSCYDECVHKFEPCSADRRQDNTDVIFVKVGEAEE